MDHEHRRSAYTGLLIACCGWSLAPVFIRLLTTTYDPFTLPLARYGAATTALVIVCLLFYRADFLRLLCNPKSLVAIALLNVAMQYTWTFACYSTTATTAQLVTKVSVVFVIVFAYFLFREERAVIRHPLFILGTLVSFVGVAAVLTDDPSSLMPRLDRTALLLVATALFWAIFSVWSKHLVMTVHPVPLTAAISCYAVIVYALIAFRFGEPGAFLELTPRTALITVLAGVIPLSIAHPTFNFAQKHLGASFCGTVTLFTPVLTYLASFIFLPNESLLPSQLAGALILIVGTLAVAIARHRTSSKEPLPESQADVQPQAEN